MPTTKVKPECLVPLRRTLLHLQLIEENLSTQDGMKHPEMHKKVEVTKIFLEVKKNFLGEFFSPKTNAA